MDCMYNATNQKVNELKSHKLSVKSGQPFQAQSFDPTILTGWMPFVHVHETVRLC